jgi:broad specificity polyphosphatase/5'/3'-nucleotidase SurE
MVTCIHAGLPSVTRRDDLCISAVYNIGLEPLAPGTLSAAAQASTLGVRRLRTEQDASPIWRIADDADIVYGKR